MAKKVEKLKGGKKAKTYRELYEFLKEDYNKFLKYHSQHPDDHLDYTEWISECIVKTTVYGWEVYYDMYYEVCYRKVVTN